MRYAAYAAYAEQHATYVACNTCSACAMHAAHENAVLCANVSSGICKNHHPEQHTVTSSVQSSSSRKTCIAMQLVSKIHMDSNPFFSFFIVHIFMVKRIYFPAKTFCVANVISVQRRCNKFLRHKFTQHISTNHPRLLINLRNIYSFYFCCQLLIDKITSSPPFSPSAFTYAYTKPKKERTIPKEANSPRPPTRAGTETKAQRLHGPSMKRRKCNLEGEQHWSISESAYTFDEIQHGIPGASDARPTHRPTDWAKNKTPNKPIPRVEFSQSYPGCQSWLPRSSLGVPLKTRRQQRLLLLPISYSFFSIIFLLLLFLFTRVFFD